MTGLLTAFTPGAGRRNDPAHANGMLLAFDGCTRITVFTINYQGLLMSKTYKVVAVSGGLQRPSRTLSLARALLDELGNALPIEARIIELAEIGGGLSSALARAQVSAELESRLREIETADALVVASPVYRASYTGLFKHLFDLVHADALIDVPVLLAATGGSERHALVIDHQLRPLFSFFQTRTLPVGVYASESDFSEYQIATPTLQARIALAVNRAVPILRAGSASATAPLAA